MTDASIIGKIKITGELILKSPLLIGDGAGETADNFEDIHVLRNSEGVPFIPGTSLCGVLREYVESIDKKSVEELFGDAKKFQSAIQIDDIKLDKTEIITRDGVRIDGLTGTGIDGGKYDYEAVDRGAVGNLNMLVNLRGCHGEILKDTITVLIGRLKNGIRLGALTSKGFGLAEVKDLKAQFYDFTKKADVIAWLTDKDSQSKTISSAKKISDSPADFIVDAKFAFNSSFIVRDYDISIDDESKTISAVSMRSRNDFVIPGTSLKGIFRHRAEYIFRKLGLDEKKLDNLMGTSDNKTKIKSRFIVAESYVKNENVADIEHTRNKIDRFTGGVLQGTLFTTKPVWQKKFDAPAITIHFEIHNAKDYEAALGICLLRDLWLGNVAIGGEKSIGRGTVKGISADIHFKGKNYKLDKNGKVTVGNSDELSKISASIKEWGDNK